MFYSVCVSTTQVEESEREREKYRFTFFASDWFYDFSMFTILIAPAIKIPFIINFSWCGAKSGGGG